jgi:drug/metabolite transporter (DMT)-like permease
MQSNVDSILKIYWRMSATAMALLPFAVKSVHKEGFPMLTLSQVFSLVLTAASYACMCSAFVISLNYTSVGNAVIFSNSQSLILLIAKLCIGETVLLTEGAGAIVAFCGAALCSRDSAGASPDGFDVTLYGDGLALLSAFAGVRYLVLAKSVRKHVTLHVFMFLVMAIGSTLILMTMVMLLSTELSFDRHLSHGIFGWMNLDADRFPLEICMVILCNVVGAMGYVRAMHYFDTLVISVSTLLEPIIAEVTAFSLGVGLLPGLMGWIGNAMVILGTFAVVLPTARKNNSSAAH